jgi:hypothetical protein
VSAAFPSATRNEVDDGVGGVETDGDTDDEADETSLHVEEGKGKPDQGVVEEGREKIERTAASTAELKLLVLLVADVCAKLMRPPLERPGRGQRQKLQKLERKRRTHHSATAQTSRQSTPRMPTLE